MFKPKVSIFAWVWVVSVLLFQAPHVQGNFEIWKQVFTMSNRWFSRDVIVAMLVDENKRCLISTFCLSTSNCTLRHCYPCLGRLVAIIYWSAAGQGYQNFNARANFFNICFNICSILLSSDTGTVCSPFQLR